MAVDFTKAIEITPIENQFTEETFSLLTKIFVSESVLHKAMDISLQEYRHYLWESFKGMTQRDIVLIAKHKNTSEILGCIVACDYHANESFNTWQPSALRPITKLLNDLQAIYDKSQKNNPGECLLVDMAVVKQNARGQGMYGKLRESVHQAGKEAGFIRVVGELSSTRTQKHCVSNLQQKVCAEIEFASFEFEGNYPFVAIDDPASIILVEGQL